MKTYFTLMLALLVSAYSAGQEIKTDTPTDSLTVFEFTLKDGSKILGQLLDQNKEYYSIKSSNLGMMRLEVNNVVSVVRRSPETQLMEDKSSDAYQNQFGFKYFLISTAIPAEPKKWYYTNQYIFFSGFTYGISKRVSAGVSFFTFVPTTFFSPNIKVTINPNSKFKVAVGGQYYLVRDGGSFGLTQLLFSSGDAQNNFTFGYSGFISSKGDNTGSVITFGFVKKVSDKLSVISENNFIVPSDTSTRETLGFLSAGIRFNRRVHAFDLGVYVPSSNLDNYTLSLIPYVGLNVKMSK